MAFASKCFQQNFQLSDVVVDDEDMFTRMSSRRPVRHSKIPYLEGDMEKLQILIHIKFD
ncbi:hypothetical protein Ga0061062_11298 [Comamonas thiooxydans]|nr:hypothetical protein Ga0061062_11298 [Comamonas thiooxydans]